MAGKRVIVVDDSEVVLLMTSAALQSAGYEVKTLMRWEELDGTLKEFRPDLILFDVNMREMYGDFALMFFKEERNITDIPILLFSDIDVGELEQRAKDCGANGFVSKTWGVERMVEVVTEHLASKKEA
jgi:two-component system chemotaxis response regulator CheY